MAGVSLSPPNFISPAAATPPGERPGRGRCLPAAAGRIGRRALALGSKGQRGSGDGEVRFFPCQRWTFCLLSGTGWRADGCRPPCSCYTPSFVCSRVRNTLRAAIACSAGREPFTAERLLPGFTPLAAPAPASFPFPFIFTEVGFSLTFV